MNTEGRLPIVEELGAEFRAMVHAELRESSSRAPSGRARLRLPAPRRPRRAAHRVARRAAIVLALLCLIGGVALAARFGGGNGGPPGSTTPAKLETDAAAGWQLSAYRHDGHLCIVLMVEGTPTVECRAAPGPRGVLAASAIGSRGRLIFGLAGRRVRRLLATVGAERAGGRVHPIRGRAAREAGVPPANSWFVIALDGTDSSHPSLLTPLTTSGRPLGPTILDCSLGAVSHACERKIEARAERALR